MFVISVSLLLCEVNSNGLLKSQIEILCRRSRLKTSESYNFFLSLLFILQCHVTSIKYISLNIQTFQLHYLVLADAGDFSLILRSTCFKAGYY